MPVAILMSDFDLPTRSASGFILRYIAPRVEPVQLFSVLVRRLPFQLSAPQSDIIIGVGHGEEAVFSGHNETIILEVGNYNSREVEGKVVKLLSCQTGVLLGPDLIKNGAEAFLGYVDDYIWVMDSDLAATPWSDEMAATCLMPVVDSIGALLDGKIAREAFDIELEGYTRNAEVEEDELIKSCLEFNRDNAVLLGAENAKIKARHKLPLPFRLVPPPPILVPFRR